MRSRATHGHRSTVFIRSALLRESTHEAHSVEFFQVAVSQFDQPFAAEALAMPAMHHPGGECSQALHCAYVVFDRGVGEVVQQFAIVNGIAGKQRLGG